MRIGVLSVVPGEKAFGFLGAGESRGRFPAHVPLHIVRGTSDGPTLVVQAGMSGLELEPAIVLPRVVRALDPKAVKGTLVVVPLLNTSGFEFEQSRSLWDDRELNELGRGSARGSIGEQLLHRYFEQVIAPASALIDIRTGAQWGYFRYAGIYVEGPVGPAQSLATALCLPHVLLGQPADRSLAFQAARDGKIVVSAWIGGGPGIRDYREEDHALMRGAVLNAMRHLGMIDDDGGKCAASQVIDGHTFLRHAGKRGLIFMAKERRGLWVAAGDAIGYVRDAFSGEIVETITAPRSGIMLHAGAAWPVVPEGAILAILGDPITSVGNNNEMTDGKETWVTA
jgi:predicted deacylase